MIFNNKSPQSGFTVTEVMVTLVVASILLFAGFNLHAVILQNQVGSTTSAKASDIAYSYLRKRAANKTSFATGPYPKPFNEVPDASMPSLPEMTISSSVSKPSATLPDLFRVETTLRYPYKGKELIEVQVLYVY